MFPHSTSRSSGYLRYPTSRGSGRSRDREVTANLLPLLRPRGNGRSRGRPFPRATRSVRPVAAGGA
jgi:hypothetical protein